MQQIFCSLFYCWHISFFYFLYMLMNFTRSFRSFPFEVGACLRIHLCICRRLEAKRAGVERKETYDHVCKVDKGSDAQLSWNCKIAFNFEQDHKWFWKLSQSNLWRIHQTLPLNIERKVSTWKAIKRSIKNPQKKFTCRDPSARHVNHL